MHSGSLNHVNFYLFTRKSGHLISIQLVGIFLYGAIIIIFVIFLKKLVDFSKSFLSINLFSYKQDSFIQTYGYTWDFVFVFKVLTEDEKLLLTSYQKEYSMKHCIERLQAASLDIKLFYSCQRDEVFIKIRASRERLLAEANRIEYKLKLDKEQLISKLQAGKLVDSNLSLKLSLSKKNSNGGYKWKPITIDDRNNVSSIEPCDFIYGPYKVNSEFQALYQSYKTSQDGITSILQEVDRIKLLISIIEADPTLHPPGAGLNLEEIKLKKVTLAYFPLHNYTILKELQEKW